MNDSRPIEDRLTSHLTNCVVEYVCEPDGQFEWALPGGEVFEVEEVMTNDAPIILIRRSDGSRFEVDVVVTAWPVRDEKAAKS